MAISKREVQLSQDLMELQSRYNELVDKHAEVLKSARFFRDESFKYQDELNALNDVVSILKSTAKKCVTSTAKKIAAKTK